MDENFPRHRELWEGRIVPKKDLEWRNEEEYVLYLKHLKAYDFALKYVKGKSILDVGCGSGYGIALLSNIASHATGIDISQEAVRYCKKRYQTKNLEFRHVKSNWIRNGLPFKKHSFDVCVSFQVIEHIHPKNIELYISEIRKVLKKGGLFILSTPNSRLRLLPFQKSRNPFHMKEYDYKELASLLWARFSRIEMYGLYGTKEASMVEYKRVKQSPLKVYILRPSYRLLKILAPSLSVFLKKAKTNLKKTKREGWEAKNYSLTDVFSLNDFKVVRTSEENLRSCWDLICVCCK